MSPGPLPLPDHERERRNLSDRFVEAPSFGGSPAPEPKEGWSPEARRWWSSLTSSPMASMYTSMDWETAIRAADLITLAEGATTLERVVTALREVRMLEQALLTTVRARRMARLELPEEGSGEDGDGSPTADDYRRMLGADE